MLFGLDPIVSMKTTGTVWAGIITFGESFGASAVLYLQGIRDQGGSFRDIDPISLTIGILLALGAVRNGMTLLRTEPPQTPQQEATAKARTARLAEADISLDDIL